MTVTAASKYSAGAGIGAYQQLQMQRQMSQKREMTSEEQRTVDSMRQRDAEVRRHEQQHLTVAGSYGQGPPTYEYEEAPDGKRYAVAGHVRIDTSEVSGDPEATIEKARVVKLAALAPQQPSNQDRSIAQQAERMEARAQDELDKIKKETATQAQASKQAPQAGKQITAFPIAAGDASLQYQMAGPA